MNRGQKARVGAESTVPEDQAAVSNQTVVGLLEELVAWMKVAHRRDLLDILKHALSDQRHLIAYELSDGTKLQREIAQASGLSQPAVSVLWTKWKRMGIVRERNGKVMHLARPSDLGILVPETAVARAPSPKSGLVASDSNLGQG